MTYTVTAHSHYSAAFREVRQFASYEAACAAKASYEELGWIATITLGA